MKNKYNIFKIIIIVIIIGIIAFASSKSASIRRAMVDLKSDMSGGLERTINICNADGSIYRTFHGKIDLDVNDGGYVKFDLDGKRYIYYHAFAEVIGDIE